MSLSARPAGIALAIAFAGVVAAVVWNTQPPAGGQLDSTLPPGDEAGEDAEVARAIDRRVADMSAHGHAARSAAADVRQAMAEAIAGSDDDPADLRERIERRAERLRDAADELAAAATVRQQPGAVPTATPGPLLERLDTLRQRASDTARALHDTAERAEQLGLAALELTDHTSELVAATAELPDGDDPAEVADAWEDELDALAAYRAAADEAAEHPELAGLAAVHLDVIDGLEATAVAATEHLDDGDVEPYDQQREAQLERAAELADELLAAVQRSLDASTAVLDRAEERTVALLVDLADLRRDAADAPDPVADA